VKYLRGQDKKDCNIPFEGYIHYIICNRLENNFLKIEAKAYSPSASSSHLIWCPFKWETQIEEQLCSCTAGYV